LAQVPHCRVFGVLVPWVRRDGSNFGSHPISVSFESMVCSLGQSVVYSHCKKTVVCRLLCSY